MSGTYVLSECTVRSLFCIIESACVRVEYRTYVLYTYYCTIMYKIMIDFIKCLWVINNSNTIS
jgi:hypothetical protein